MNPENWTNSIILLVAIPAVAGILLLPLMNYKSLSRFVGLTSFIAMAVTSLWLLIVAVGNGESGGNVLVTQLGGWPAPFGIPLIFDSLSGLLVTASCLVAIAAYVHSFSSLDWAVERRYFHPLMQFLLMGVNLAFMTGDLFNLFVSFEIMLLASYALMCIGASKDQLRHAYKYVFLNLFASAIFVMAAGMTYGITGTLNLAELARIVMETNAAGESMPTGFTALGVTLLLVFALKGAFFPLWFWLPDTYWTTPIAIAGLFGAILTKVGVYAVARTYPMIFAAANADTSIASAEVLGPILAISSAFTMFLAVLGAVCQHSIRRILAIHVISQVGYMIFGIALGILYATNAEKFEIGAAAMAGVAFYIIHNMVVKCALFLCCGAMEKHAGSDDLDRIGGVLKRDVWLGVLFLIAAMSLVGFPPLSGFFGKMTIIQAGWHDYWYLSVVGLATGCLTLLSMLKIWSYGFWSPAESVKDEQNPSDPKDAAIVRGSIKPMYFGISMLVVIALLMGFGGEVIYSYALNAGEQLIDPTVYVESVLGVQLENGLPITELATTAEPVEAVSQFAEGVDLAPLSSASVDMKGDVQ